MGSALLADAFRKVVRASESLAGYAGVVDAKDEEAKACYERFGFLRLAGKRLFYPLTAIERLIG